MLKLKILEISFLNATYIDFNLIGGKRLLLIGETLDNEDSCLSINYITEVTENDLDVNDVITNNLGKVAKKGISKKYYCGGSLFSDCECCDGHCGKNDGCNCWACMILDIKMRNVK
jgi:hypothetical protein